MYVVPGGAVAAVVMPVEYVANQELQAARPGCRVVTSFVLCHHKRPAMSYAVACGVRVAKMSTLLPGLPDTTSRDDATVSSVEPSDRGV